MLITGAGEQEAGRAGLLRPGRREAHSGRSPGRLLAAGIRAGRPAVGAGQSQQRRDRRRRRVCAERAGQRHGRAQGRSPGRPARLSRHDGALHAAHARAAGRVGQGALRGRHAAFRRGERHHRRPARRPAPPSTSPGSTGRRRSTPRSACRSPARRRTSSASWRGPSSACRKDVLYDYRRLGGEVAVDLSLGFPLLNALAVADIDIKAEASLTRFSLQDAIGDVDLSDATARVKYGNSELSRQRHRQARRQCRRDRLARAVRRQGAVPPPLRAEGHGAGGAGRQGGLPVARALRQRAARHDALVSGGDQRDERGGRPLRHQGGQGRRGAARLGQGARRRGPAHDDHEARRRRQAHDHRFRRPRPTGCSAKGQVRFAGDNALQQITVQQFKIGQTDVAGDWKRGPGGVEVVAARAESLELPRVRAMMKARDELAAKEPAGAAAAARSSTKMTLQLQQVLTKRGTLGYAQRPPGACRASASPSADLSIGARQGLDLPRHAGGAGPQALPLCRRLRPDAEGCRLARRAGRRLPRTSRASTTTPSPARRSTAPEARALPAAEGDAARRRRHAEHDDRRAEPRRQRPAAVRQPRGQDHQDRRSHPHQNGRTSGQSIGLTDRRAIVDLGNDTAQACAASSCRPSRSTTCCRTCRCSARC